MNKVAAVANGLGFLARHWKFTVPAVVALYIAGSYASVYEHTQVIVTDKARTTGMMLVYTDKGTFKMEDTYLFWRLNTSDEYGKLIVGETYDLSASGFRWNKPTFYENIISFEQVSK